MINPKISECSKVTQEEYKTRHDWVGKVIHWELCKKVKFDHSNKWYMHNPESVREKETHKLLRGSKRQITTRRAEPVIIKKTKKLADFVVLASHGVKLKEEEMKDKDLDLARE